MNTLQMIKKLFAHPCTFEDVMFEERHSTTKHCEIAQDLFGDIWLLKEGDPDNGQALLYNKELGLAKRIKL